MGVLGLIKAMPARMPNNYALADSTLVHEIGPHMRPGHEDHPPRQGCLLMGAAAADHVKSHVVHDL